MTRYIAPMLLDDSRGSLAQPVLSFKQAEEIAQVNGTPFLALSPTRITENANALRRGLPGVELFYAMKSNPDPGILEVLSGLVDGIDVASYGEVCTAAAAGYVPERLIHTNPIKKESDIGICVQHGVRWFTFDNLDEVGKLEPYAQEMDLLLRLAIPDTKCTVNLSSKFGVYPGDVSAILRSARDAGLRVRGVAFHVGSQCGEPKDYERALRLARAAFDEGARVGYDFDVLDIGGGFPVSYRSSMPELERFCGSVMLGIREFFPDPLRIIAEPGRSISGEAMTLAVRVIGRAVRNGVRWYYIDDGVYGAFSGMVFDGCDYRLVSERPGGVEECVVAGPSCDSIDVVSRDQLLPRLEVGDLLMVPGMGAYTKAHATRFNGFAPPATIVLPDARIRPEDSADAERGADQIENIYERAAL